MRQVGGHFLLGLGVALFAAIAPLSGGEPASPGLHPYSFQENPIIDGPSTCWLVPGAQARAKTPIVWCKTSDEWDEVLRIDGLDVHYLTDKEMAEYFAGAHGWPVTLLVKPKSGGTHAVECFQHQ